LTPKKKAVMLLKKKFEIIFSHDVQTYSMEQTRLAQVLTNNFKELLNQGLQPLKDQLHELKIKNKKSEYEIDEYYFQRKESDDPDYCLQNGEDANNLIDFIIDKKLDYTQKISTINQKLNCCPSFVALRYFFFS